MNEKQQTIILLFHESHSLLRTCREDCSIMIEQHGRGALQADRIVETARRLDSVLDSIPHMSDLIEAIDDEPVAELPAVEESVVEEPETEAALNAAAEAAPEDAVEAGLNAAAEAEPDATGDPGPAVAPEDD